MWNDITVDVINGECDPEESNQGGIEPGPLLIWDVNFCCPRAAHVARCVAQRAFLTWNNG